MLGRSWPLRVWGSISIYYHVQAPIGGQKIIANIPGQSSSRTLRVMDVCAKNHPTCFHADFGKESPSQSLWRGPAWNCPLQALCCATRLTEQSTFCREEKSVHNHHRKKIFCRTFLASKKNFPGRWWIQKPYKNQENHIHHRNLSSVDPIFFCKEKFCTGAGWCMLSFSQFRGEKKRAERDWEKGI